MSLTRAELKRPPVEVKLTDGRTVSIRRLAMFERADYLGLCAEKSQEAEGKSGRERLRAAMALAGELVALTLVSDDGKQLYTDGADVASDLDEELVEEIGKHAAAVNRMGKPTDPNV
jgi:hypothetical protein